MAGAYAHPPQYTTLGDRALKIPLESLLITCQRVGPYVDVELSRPFGQPARPLGILLVYLHVCPKSYYKPVVGAKNTNSIVSKPLFLNGIDIKFGGNFLPSPTYGS